MNYVNLHNHTYYSILDGLNSPLEYMERAVELGMSAMAITDHGVMSGHREFQRAAKETGVKPILGMEAYYTKDASVKIPASQREPGDPIYNHMTVLAKDATGLATLGRLSEQANNYGFYSKPRIGKKELFNDHEGLIILSGCMSGVIAKAIEREELDEALAHALEWKDTFGGNFFIEIMSSNAKELNLALLDIADKANIPPVMTEDSHYANKEDLWVEQAMLILASGPKPLRGHDFAKSKTMEILDRFDYLYPDRRMNFREIEIYVRDYQTEVEKFAEQGITRTDIYENTLAIADSVGEYEYPEGVDLLPTITVEDSELALRRKVFSGLRKRGIDKDPEVIARANMELKTIHEMGFDDYFLIVEDAVSFARRSKIRMSPGRGSAAACICCYALYVTDINPLDYGLLFFRFLDPSRKDYPDIDLDFQASRRHEVKDYMRAKYDNVASISTFGYYTEKGVIRDACRAFKIPVGEMNKMLKKISRFDEYLYSSKVSDFRLKYPEVERLALALRGRIRQQGVHAGGLVLSKEPISKYAPMMSGVDPDNKNGPRIPVVGYDMNEVAAIGLIKFDFLGVTGLDVIDECLALIKERRKIDIDMSALPLDCKEVYDALSAGYTKGLFQVNASASTKLLGEMGGVSNFNELAASNALVRPGAANSSIGKDYIKGKKTGVVNYVHPDVKPFTTETYGVCIFQEQQMLLCVELAGMTMEEANAVRKAIGKKKPEELAKWENVFIDGATKKIGRAKAVKAWKDLKASEDYAFGKGHSVAYSLLTYQMAWLKQYYPLEFMTAALRNESEKDKRLELLMEAKRMGLRIVLPHVNESDLTFTIQTDERGDFIRMGLVDVKNIGNVVGRKIIEARPFDSYAQLESISTTKYSGINARVLTSLNMVGAAAFPDNPLRGDERDHFFEYLSIPAFEVKALSERAKLNITPLEEFDPNETFVCMGMVIEIKRGPGWARLDLVDESGKAGVFTDENTQIEEGNFYVFLVSTNSVVKYVTLNDIAEGRGGAINDWLESDFDDVPDGKHKVIAFRSRKTKAGKNMANIVFADAAKELSGAVVFDSGFIEAYSKCQENSVVDVEFKQTNQGSITIERINV